MAGDTALARRGGKVLLVKASDSLQEGEDEVGGSDGMWRKEGEMMRAAREHV